MQAKKNEQNGMQNVYITVSNALDQSDKQRIEVAKDLTVEQAIRQEGLAPAGAFDVFDATGRVISNEKVAQLAEENVYVGVQKVAGGANLPMTRLTELRTDYPSLRTIRGRQTNGEATMFAIRLPDGKNRTKNGYYECVVDANSMITYVLNTLTCGRHPHAYSRITIPGTKRQSYGVCQGDIGKIIGVSADPIEIIGSYLNHIISVLNS